MSQQETVQKVKADHIISGNRNPFGKILQFANDIMGTGAVISVKNLKNPIEAAYRLSKKKTNCILAGEGAEKYASYEGLPYQNMLT